MNPFCWEMEAEGYRIDPHRSSMQIVQICPDFNVVKCWSPALDRSTVRAAPVLDEPTRSFFPPVRSAWSPLKKEEKSSGPCSSVG